MKIVSENQFSGKTFFIQFVPALVDVDAAVHAGPARQALALAAPHARRAVLARVGGGAGVHLVLTSCA